MARMLRSQRRRIIGFKPDELVTLMALPGQPGLVLRFLLGTGLRWAEACRAIRDHVHGTLLDVGNTKSGRLRRVTLHSEWLEELSGREQRRVPYAAGSPGSFSLGIRRRAGLSESQAGRDTQRWPTQM